MVIRKVKILFVLFLIICSVSNAQFLPGGIDDKHKDDFKETGNLSGTSYASFQSKYSKAFSEYGIDLGLNAGIMLNNFFGLGFNISYLATKPVSQIDDRSIVMRMSYYGLEPELVYNFSSKLHLSFRLMTGLAYIDYGENNVIDLPADYNGDWIFITEPSAVMNLKILKSFWIGFYGGYRIAQGVQLYGFDSEDMSGLFSGLQIKLIIK